MSAVIRVGALCAVAFGLNFCPSAGAATAAAEEPSLAVLNTANTLKVSGSEGEDTATGYVSLLNSGTEPITVTARFQAAGSERVRVRSVAPDEVEPGAQRIGITFAGLEELTGAATGQLVIDGGPSLIAQSVEVLPAPQPSAPWPEILILGSLAAAVMLALMVVGNIPDREKVNAPLSKPAPGVKWDAKSWATTLTAVGGILGTVLGGVTFPTYPEQIAKVSLVNLNLFFGILVVVGPFLFQALRRKELSDEERKSGCFGTNLTLLMTSTITLWAVFGQLGAFALLSWELVGGGVLGPAILAALVALGLLAARYFFLTMSEAILKDWSETPTAAPEAEAEEFLPPWDISAADRLYFRAPAPFVRLSTNPDSRQAEVIVQPPAAQPAPSWSLL